MAKLTRRQSLKRATLFAFAMALGKLDALKAVDMAESEEGRAGSNGELTADLNQWAAVVFKYRGKTVRVPMVEVFASLETVAR